MEGGCKCGICSKSFPNQQALGGHMRSHFVFLPISPKPETSGDSKAQSKRNQPSTSGLADKSCMKRGTLIHNPNKSSQPVADQSKSNEIQQSEFPRVRTPSKESTDMLSVTSSDEDVAHALVDLSKGKMTNTRRKIDRGKRKLDAYRGGSGDGEERKDYDEDKESSNQDHKDDQTQLQERMPEQVRQRPAGKEVLQSIKTLGQHNIRAQQDATKGEKMVMENKGGNSMTMYQCLSSPSNSPSSIPSSSIPAEPIEWKKQLPDLNLPPPDEDDEII